MTRSFISILLSFVLYTAAILLLVAEPSHSLWLLGAGLPGLVTILLTGYLVERAGLDGLEVRSLVQVSGLSWQVGLGFVCLHAFMTGGAATLTAPSGLAALWFGLWAMVTLRLIKMALVRLGGLPGLVQTEVSFRRLRQAELGFPRLTEVE